MKGPATAMILGLIGLGVIGWRVAANLKEAGYLSVVYNRTGSKASEFGSKFSVAVSKTPEELTQRCDVIVTVLSDDEALREVYERLLPTAGPGKLFVDMSTVSPYLSVEISKRAGEKQASMIDAPVVGTAGMVERKEATLLVGGSRGTVERLMPVLQATAKEVIRVGPNGTGLSLKLVHNLALASYIVALSEAVNFGLASGLSPELIEKLFVSLSSIRSPNSGVKVPKILRADYSPQFSLKHMVKDLEIIQSESRRLGAPTPLGALSTELYKLAQKRGYRDEDYVAVAELFRGTETGPQVTGL